MSGTNRGPCEGSRAKHDWEDPDADTTHCLRCRIVRTFTGKYGVAGRKIFGYRHDTDFEAGTRVRLVFLGDGMDDVKPGQEGVVASIDGEGVVHIVWNDGTRLGIIPGVDVIERVA